MKKGGIKRIGKGRNKKGREGRKERGGPRL